VASASASDRREEPPAPVASAAPSPSNENEPAAPSAASSAAPSQSLRVQLGAFTSSGGLPPEVVQRIVRQRVPSYRKCYEDGLKKRADLMGRVVVRFIIDASGDVSDPIQVGQDMGDQNVATCVGDVFKTLIFPSPGNGPMTVVFPISFAP
jgi:outer membrane biosynthesis protein TonB